MLISEEEKKKREEEARSIINMNSFSDAINDINYANMKGQAITTNNNEEKLFVDRVNEANEIINSVNPRQNISAPSISEEESNISKQNAEKVLGLIDQNTESKEEIDNIDYIERKEADEIQQNQESNTDKHFLSQLGKTIENLWLGAVTGAKSMISYVTNTDPVNKQLKAQQVAKTAYNKSIPLSVRLKYDEENNNSILSNMVKDKIKKNPNENMIPISEESEKKINDELSEYTDSYGKIELNPVRREMSHSIAKDQSKIASNVNKISNPVLEKIAELAPSAGNSLAGAGLSIINPYLGMSYFMISASGSYELEGKNRGMTKEQARDYGLVMGWAEGASEMIGVDKFLSAGSSLRKGAFKEALKAYGIDMVDNAIQEALIDPIDELTSKAISGKTKNDYSNSKGYKDLGKDMIKDGIDGALSSLLMNGVGIGIDSSVHLYNKIQNGDNITQQEIQKTYSDIQKNKDINILEHFKDSFEYQKEKLNDGAEQVYSMIETNQEGNVTDVIQVLGYPINMDNNELNITPAVVYYDGNYNVIDTQSGTKLDTTLYETKKEAIDGFNTLIENIDNATINNVNNKTTKNKLALINKMQEIQEKVLQNPEEVQKQNKFNFVDDDRLFTTEETKQILKGYDINENVSNRPYIGKEINDIINNNIVEISQDKNTDNFENETTSYIPEDNKTDLENNNINNKPQKSTFYTDDVKYQVSNINEIEKAIGKDKSYTLEEIGEKWSDISENTWELTLNDDNYVSLDENNGKLEAVLYDGETSKAIDSVEIKKNKDGKYSSIDINNAVKKVATIIDENKPIKGQVDIEGNEVRQMKKNNKTSTQEVVKSIENFKKAKIKISRQDVLNIANNLDIKLKPGATIITDTEMSKRAGKNKNPIITKITDVFKNISDSNAKDFRNNAKSIAMELFRDLQVKIIDTNTVADINKEGIRKTFSGKVTESKIQTADNIKDIIEQGIYGFTSHNPSDNTGILYHHFFTPVNYKGNNELIRVVIKEYTQNKTMNDKFYYHQLEYIDNNKIEDISSALPRKSGSKDVEPISSVKNSIPQKTKSVKSDTAINKKSMQNRENDTTRNMKKQNGGLTKTQYDSDGNEITYKQAQYFKNSKVRDNEGNLKVVYHGTNNAGFTEFKRNINYYTDSKDIANTYTGNDGMYEGYINITNPIVVDANKEVWSKIDIDNIKIDGIENIKEFLDSYGASTWKENGKLRTSTADIVSAISDAIDDGRFEADGIIINNVYDEGAYSDSTGKYLGNDYITFKSNQFKNTTNEAPTSSDDIRYMKKGNTKSSQKVTDNRGRELSKQQQEYFKDSKVRDEKGNLLVAYHGTDSNFNEFNHKYIGEDNKDGFGFYFTTSKLQFKYDYPKTTYLNIKRPATNNELIDTIIKREYELFETIKDKKKVLLQIQKEFGVDGIIDKDRNNIVAFNSNQIKNITNEAPTSNNDIRYMKKGNTKSTQNQKVVDNHGRELSKQQQDYFKDSIVRNDNGNLKAMYHGSNNIFTIFKKGKAYKGSSNASVGYWFTETEEGARKFADSVWYGDTKTGSKIYEVYLNMTNPKIYENVDNTAELERIDNKLDELKNTIRKLENKNIAIEINKQELRWANNTEELQDIAKYEGIDFEDAEEYHNAIKEYNNLENEYDNAKYNDSYEQFRADIYKIAGKSAKDANFAGTGMYLENQDEIIEQYVSKLKQEGYDGIIIKNTKFDNDTLGKENSQYVVFDSNQIKNVDNTNPTSNEDIRFAKRTAKNEKNNNNNDNTQRNAERQGSYIEEEIQKIEKTGKWDNTIPATKLSDIRKTIEDYLGLGIKKGHFRQSAYAIYKGNRDIIRTKEFKDMDSILHETGHALDLGNRLKVDKESISSELLTAIDKLGGYEDESKAIRLEEGFAEVIREYSIVPDRAKLEYPQTVAVIEKIRQNDKAFDNFISKVQQQAYNYIHQNPRNRTLSNISIGEQTDKTPLTKEWLKQEVMRNIYDTDYVIKSTVSTLQKAGGKTVNQLKASDNAYLLTRLSSGVTDKVTSMLADGYIDTDGKKLMPGLNQIGEILGNDPQRFNDLRAYLVARRDTDYKSKTLKTGIRSNDSQSVIEQFKNDKQIQDASKLVYDTLDGVMKYAVRNNLITQETADSLKESNAFYVPMQRVLENNGNLVGRKGAVSDIIKKRTGSELDIKDVLENIIANSSNVIQQVENNNVLKALYKQGESVGITGKVYDVIDAPMVKVGTAKLSTWESELNKQGVDTSELDLEKTIDLFAPNNKIDAQNLITSFINDDGKRVYLQFNDEILFNSLMNVDKKFMSLALKINAKLNMPLRYGATMANVGFAIPNMISDTAQASIFSTAGFIPVVDNALGVLDILAVNNKGVRNFVNQVAPGYADKINKLYTIYQQTGATSSTRLSQYRESTQNIMKDVYGTKNNDTLGIKEKYKPLKRLLDILTYIPELSEQSTRFRVFEKNYEHYKNKGTSEMDTRILAAMESRDATQDFGRTGNLTREINQLIPFSAARVGSAYTFAEKVKANPKQVGMRIAVMTALAMAIKGIGYDDDEIEELNQRKKDDNFVLKVGGSVVTIKKPQGVLRSMINLAEYIQDLVTGHIEEGKEGERLGNWLNNAIMDNMPADEVTGLVPNMVAPVIENAINKDFYYNTDIVKSYDLDLPDSEQYYDYNSQLAIWLGKVFNYSPAKIDNLISGYFAGLGTQVTNIMDYALGKTGATAEKPEMGAETNAIGKRFIVNVNSNSASIDEIYNRKTELTKLKNGGSITDELEKELETITSALSNISNINKQIKSIKKDLTMSGKEKAEEIKSLQQQKTDTARQALGKDVIYSENTENIQSTQFYPSRDTISKNKLTLTMTSEMKKEYEQIAYNYYKQYESQGLYSEDGLDKIKSNAKNYAKNEMMKKYKAQLVNTKK